MIAAYSGQATLDVTLPERVVTLVPGKALPVTDDEADALLGMAIPGVVVRGKRTPAPLPPVPVDSMNEVTVRKSRRKARGTEEFDGNASVPETR